MGPYSNLKNCLFNLQKRTKTSSTNIPSNKIYTNYNKLTLLTPFRRSKTYYWRVSTFSLQVKNSEIIKLRNKIIPLIKLIKHFKYNFKEFYFLYTKGFSIYLKYLCSKIYSQFITLNYFFFTNFKNRNNHNPPIYLNSLTPPLGGLLRGEPMRGIISRLLVLEVTCSNLLSTRLLVIEDNKLKVGNSLFSLKTNNLLRREQVKENKLKSKGVIIFLKLIKDFNLLLKKNYKIIFFFKSIKNRFYNSLRITVYKYRDNFNCFFSYFFENSFFQIQKNLKEIVSSLTSFIPIRIQLEKIFKNKLNSINTKQKKKPLNFFNLEGKVVDPEVHCPYGQVVGGMVPLGGLSRFFRTTNYFTFSSTKKSRKKKMKYGFISSSLPPYGGLGTTKRLLALVNLFSLFSKKISNLSLTCSLQIKKTNYGSFYFKKQLFSIPIEVLRVNNKPFLPPYLPVSGFRNNFSQKLFLRRLKTITLYPPYGEIYEGDNRGVKRLLQKLLKKNLKTKGVQLIKKSIYLLNLLLCFIKEDILSRLDYQLLNNILQKLLINNINKKILIYRNKINLIQREVLTKTYKVYNCTSTQKEKKADLLINIFTYVFFMILPVINLLSLKLVSLKERLKANNSLFSLRLLGLVETKLKTNNLLVDNRLIKNNPLNKNQPFILYPPYWGPTGEFGRVLIGKLKSKPNGAKLYSFSVYNLVNNLFIYFFLNRDFFLSNNLMNNDYLINYLIKKSGNTSYSILLVYINMHYRFLTKFIPCFYLNLFQKEKKTDINNSDLNSPPRRPPYRGSLIREFVLRRGQGDTLNYLIKKLNDSSYKKQNRFLNKNTKQKFKKDKEIKYNNIPLINRVNRLSNSNFIYSFFCRQKEIKRNGTYCYEVYGLENINLVGSNRDISFELTILPSRKVRKQLVALKERLKPPKEEHKNQIAVEKQNLKLFDSRDYTLRRRLYKRLGGKKVLPFKNMQAQLKQTEVKFSDSVNFLETFLTCFLRGLTTFNLLSSRLSFIYDKRLITSNFVESRLKQVNSLSKVSLNCNIWHSNKKLHNQNSLLWIFKKYWIISYYYKRKHKNDKLLSNINRDRSFQKIDKRFSYIINKTNFKSLNISFKNTNILNIIKKTTYKQINMASIILQNKTTSNPFTLAPLYRPLLEGSNLGEFTTGLKNIIFKKNILTFILKSKLNSLRCVLKTHKFLLIKEIIIIKYIKIQSKRVLLMNNEKDITIIKKYYLLKTYLLYIK